MKNLKIIFIVIPFLFSSCSLQKIALRSTTGLLNYGVEALYDEQDLKIAEQATASNLKLLEGLHKADPENKDILFLLTQGYASYSLGFAEGENNERAKLFYLRARDYGLDLMQRRSVFKDSIPAKEKYFIEKINMASLEDVPALFWTAFAWGGWINISRDDPQAIFDLAKVKSMMRRVIQLDEDYFFGSAHLFFGGLFGSYPVMLGGDLDKAKEHFDKCLEISDGKYMMAYVYMARYYAQPLLNEELFDKYLKIVLQAPMNSLPDHQLITAIAKNKAQKLIQKKEELF